MYAGHVDMLRLAKRNQLAELEIPSFGHIESLEVADLNADFMALIASIGLHEVVGETDSLLEALRPTAFDTFQYLMHLRRHRQQLLSGYDWSPGLLFLRIFFCLSPDWRLGRLLAGRRDRAVRRQACEKE
ncbi:MAG: hypothetical protein DMF53_11820 [Acidobacteria bacterium]|nr:MAG: hypothetical protein DMF53_11820 [Acidobacteriota bacterium]